MAVERYDGALDVPAGPASTDDRVPGGFALPFGAPQQRIKRVALAHPVWVSPTFAGQREHRRPIEVAFLAEEPRCGRFGSRAVEVDVWDGVDAVGVADVIDAAIIDAADFVGEPAFEELANRGCHLVDHFCDANIVAGRDDRELFHIPTEQVDLGRSQLAPVDADRRRPLQ